MNQPVFVTGVERSGSTLIARILDICGAYKGTTTNMYEHVGIRTLLNKYLSLQQRNGELILPTDQLNIPANWRQVADKIMEDDGYRNGVWMVKSSLLTQTWPLWFYAYPNASWIIVRRRTGDIIQSCIKTAYMNTFKEEENWKKVGVEEESEGWRWWIHQYENRFREMIEAGVNCKIIWPERMVTGDYQQIYEMLEWLGLSWNSKIVETIDPMLNKSRRKV